jgi:hypothetical protein
MLRDLEASSGTDVRTQRRDSTEALLAFAEPR